MRVSSNVCAGIALEDNYRFLILVNGLTLDERLEALRIPDADGGKAVGLGKRIGAEKYLPANGSNIDRTREIL